MKPRVLITRLSSMGDVILSFPLIAKLKRKFPESEITFLTKEQYSDLLKLNNCVNKIATPDSIDINVKYDFIIDLQNNFRSRAMLRKLRGKTFRFDKNNTKKFLLVKFKIDCFKKVIPVFERYIRCTNGLISDFNFEPADLSFDKNIRFDYNYTIIAPSSKHYTKTYPKEKFVKFMQTHSDREFILLGSNDSVDISICNYIAGECDNVLNLCGKTGYAELCNLIYNADKIITNDSAILHLSEALGKPVTAIFGSTVKQFGFYPQNINSIVLEVNGLKCRPCSHIGRESCPEKHFRCMKEIELM
ncbi:glycosyltransferase family 9 protein [Ignavibacteria bacterium CHB1]|nr:MAG: glycosyltransferase family 9 protein [Chlorobiota bacterium]MBV6398253.1 hypothetical protein [Ignavibacteria bacterium]MCC6886154.1 glycosyltransferase family 9 protein [Ignavibacteriales bacterium]MCE7952594.1 glycosyltransferase family 9 protein [Chlorobi bacterium CHB7]MDL1886706.1 glycosyltransferase family 9 protein [Ignavibacteria bacterium CHB1]RIK50234.1 MAG: hypothetical protein DCC60_00075 [Ignavibacteriota bacterium]